MTATQTLIAKMVLGVLVLLTAYFGARHVLQWKADAEAYKARSAQQSRTSTATSAIAKGASKAQQDGSAAEASVDSARTDYSNRYEELRNEDQAVADWDAGLIPDSVRELARARRCARDGSRGAAAGCPQHDAAARSTGSNQAP